jgi:hypothetical protein
LEIVQAISISVYSQHFASLTYSTQYFPAMSSATKSTVNKILIWLGLQIFQDFFE